MVPPEHHNTPPQASLPRVEQTRDPQNSAGQEAAHFDILKPHVSALLGLTPVEVPTGVGHTPPLPLGVEQIRAKRREPFEPTDCILPIAGDTQKAEPQELEEDDEALQRLEQLGKEIEEEDDEALRKLEQLGKEIEEEAPNDQVSD